MKEKNIEIRKCKLCNKEFEVNLNSKRDRNRNFCNRKCSSSYNGKNNKGILRTEEFKKNLSEKMRGENNPFYGKKHSQEFIERISQQRKGISWEEKYGKEKSDILKEQHRQIFSGENNPFYGKSHTLESKALISEHHVDCGGENNPNFGNGDKLRGERNPSWKGGISYEEYGCEFNEDVKNKIRRRDSFRCYICQKNGFVIHHIDYNKKNNQENNLITLCRSCHGKTGFNRQQWILFFNNIGEKNE